MAVSNRCIGLMSAALALAVLVVCSGKDNPSGGGGETTGGTVTVDSTGGTTGGTGTVDTTGGTTGGTGTVDTTGGTTGGTGTVDTTGGTTGGDGEAKTYTLTAIVSPADGGWVALDPSKARYDDGTVVTLTATPKTGFEFTGWSGAILSKNSAVKINMNSNKEVTANFREILYTLTVTETPGGKATLSPNQASYRAGTQVTLTAVPDDGYFFGGWGATHDRVNPTVITVDGDHTYTASFVQGYKLNAYADDRIRGGVTLSPAQPANGYPPWSEVTATATANTGYRFAGWSGTSSSNGNIVKITINGNGDLKANFEPTVEYTLTLDVSPKSCGTVKLVSGAPHYHGTTAVVLAQPADGYGFAGWSGASTSTSASESIIMDGNKTLTANFARVYTLTTIADPPSYGTVRRNPDKKSYLEGTEVTLTPQENRDGDSTYLFVGWAGESSSPPNRSKTVIMDGDKTVTANFEQVYQLFINIKPDNSGTVSGSTANTYYRVGSKVTVTATPRANYTFIGWSGASTSTDATITITIQKGGNTVTANFERQ